MSQLSLSSGKTRRKFPTLSTIQRRIEMTVTSPTGSHMGGLLSEGDLFVWNKGDNVLATFVTPLSKIGSEKYDAASLKGKFYMNTSLENCSLNFMLITCGTNYLSLSTLYMQYHTLECLSLVLLILQVQSFFLVIMDSRCYW